MAGCRTGCSGWAPRNSAFGGITLWRSANATLMSPATPAARLEVADVRLDRADHARAVPYTALRQNRPNASASIASPRSVPSALRFDVLDDTGGQTRALVCVGQYLFLGQPVGRHQSVGPPVLVHGATTDHRVDRVAIGQRPTQRLEHDDSGAFAANASVGAWRRRSCSGRPPPSLRLGEIDIGSPVTG